MIQISDPAFLNPYKIRTYFDCSSLVSVNIPNSVTSIGDFAFDSCTSLTGVNIPNSVTIIMDGAFSHCTSLASITIPDSVTSIEGQTFEHCTSLNNITIPNSVTRIGSWAFEDCTSLKSITIPDRVTGTGDGAFAGCTSLTSVTFQGTIALKRSYITDVFYGLGDLRDKYLAGGTGTYKTTAPVKENSKWTKQSDSSNKSVPAEKSSGSVSAFPGRWELIEGDGDAENVELFKDGTGAADGYGITWKVENGRFHVLHPWYTFSAYYNVTSSTLTLITDDDEVIKYRKK